MKDSLRTISKWGAFLGYVNIISGIICLISGILFLFLAMSIGNFYNYFTETILLGIIVLLLTGIPGITCIFLGLYLLRSAKEAKRLLEGFQEEVFERMLENYAKFMKLNGVVILMLLVVFVFGIATASMTITNFM